MDSHFSKKAWTLIQDFSTTGILTISLFHVDSLRLKELASWCIFLLQNSSKASKVSSAVLKLTMYSWNVWVVNILEASTLQILSEVMKMSQMYCGKVPDRQMLKSTQNVFTKFYFLRKWISKAWLILHISQNQMAYKNVFISAKC